MAALKINGKVYEHEVPADVPLLWVLRDVLDLKGSKYGCGMGLCGACTVHIDGEARRSCMTPVGSVGSAAITTIEGVGATPLGQKVQQAWCDVDVAQCGYCQAGQVMSATALLAKNPQPSDKDIDDAMSGNVCRCCTYIRIRSAIKQAAGVPSTAAEEG